VQAERVRWTSSQVNEALDLLQEECGEVVQARSKLRRFGPEFRGRGGKAEHTALEEFQREVYDVLILIDYLVDAGYIDKEYWPYYVTEKLDKLTKWTNLFHKENDNVSV
jgi:NTP pyrophosphatase (non-canonical NTP hydrolase)